MRICPVGRAALPTPTTCDNCNLATEAPASIYRCHCEGVSPWQSVLFPSPMGDGRCFAPQGMRIATGLTALAMTVVVGARSFRFSRAIVAASAGDS